MDANGSLCQSWKHRNKAMKTIGPIEGHLITVEDSGVVSYTAKMAIDGDGSSGNTYHDPDWQGETSLKVHGVSLNAETERYIVVPPAIIQGVAPVVLGCQAFVTYRGTRVSAVVGDIGPRTKLGEASIACAKSLNIPYSPLTGGVESGVTYEIHPGVPAVVDGKTYPLQHS